VDAPRQAPRQVEVQAARVVTVPATPTSVAALPTSRAVDRVEVRVDDRAGGVHPCGCGRVAAYSKPGSTG